MAFKENHSWTLGGLTGAFVDLVLAYFLLYGSAIAFVASKFFRIFGLYLPCPCKGVFGYKNSDLCMHKILFDWPLRKICYIQMLAMKRLPFDLVWVKDHMCNSNENMTKDTISEKRAVELEDEASCSSCSGTRLLSSVDRECGYDAKGKRTTHFKRRSVIRRRRRSSYECGKFSSVLSSENLQSDDTHSSSFAYDGSMVSGKKSIYSRNPALGKGVSEVDVEDTQTGRDMDERTCRSYEFSRSLIDSSTQDKYSSSLESYVSNTQDKMEVVGNAVNHVKLLEQALEEEKAAYTDLCLELEKERAAAATAADEAMAMISRLQEEKASIELEIKHYQRMVEERVAYDEEEMDILKEILMRREIENHFLEKELETYREMNFGGPEQSNGEAKVPLNEWGQMPSFSLQTSPRQINGNKSNVKNVETANISSSYQVAQTCTRNDDVEKLEKNEEQKDQIQLNPQSSFLNTEPDTLDVHVTVDNMELRKNESKKISGFSFDNTLNESRNRNRAFGNLGVYSSNVSTVRSKTSKAEGREFSYSDTDEKYKIGTEIEMLRKRLRMLQNEKGKLSSFPDNGELRRNQLKLLEEIANQLEGIKQLRNPPRRASLPPSYPKVGMKKRRCQSENESS
ncbi:hypothetical protein L6164_003242 [Bauhinia variegata]|uniref:Uncharacterized protein n=1 Tax=Bauhinia variegata TaxID=167791 RepID=A0ACB9Q1A7_BAUVA|nr:hypothetical protein L6164_003242 [Bauhinia variegata]